MKRGGRPPAQWPRPDRASSRGGSKINQTCGRTAYSAELASLELGQPAAWLIDASADANLPWRRNVWDPRCAGGDRFLLGCAPPASGWAFVFPPHESETGGTPRSARRNRAARHGGCSGHRRGGGPRCLFPLQKKLGPYPACTWLMAAHRGIAREAGPYPHGALRADPSRSAVAGAVQARRGRLQSTPGAPAARHVASGAHGGLLRAGNATANGRAFCAPVITSRNEVTAASPSSFFGGFDRGGRGLAGLHRRTTGR